MPAVFGFVRCRVVTGPTGEVGGGRHEERLLHSRLRDRDRLRLRAPEAETQVERGARFQLLGDDDVTGGRGRVCRGQGVARVELHGTVGRAAGVTDRRPLQLRRVKRHERRHGVVAIGGLADGARVAGDPDAGGVDGARVGAAVRRAAATVAVDVGVEVRVHMQGIVVSVFDLQARVREHRVAGGIGDVGRDQLVAVCGARGGDGAAHAGRIGRHGVGRVAGLQVGEGRSVGHDVLQGLDIGVVHRRLVDVGEHPVGDGEPDLRGGVARGADAVLAGGVEVGQCARSPGSDRWRGGTGRRQRRHEQRQRGHTAERGKPTGPSRAGLRHGTPPMCRRRCQPWRVFSERLGGVKHVRQSDTTDTPR